MSTSTLGEEFDDELDNFQNQIYNLQNQIDQLKEQVGGTLSPSTTAPANTYIITHRGSTPEEENKPTSNACYTPDSECFWRDMPDSEGFWRDGMGDVWVRDIAGTMRLISKGRKHNNNEIYDQSHDFGSDFNLHVCGPYVKIDNPFLQSEDNAD